LITWEPAAVDEQRASSGRSGGLAPFASDLPVAPTRRLLRELPVLVAVAAVIAFFLKTFVAQAFYIPSPSMVSQLEINDRVVVSKLAYRFHEPRRGDIVVFDCPPRAACDNAEPSSNPVARAARVVGEAVGIVQPSTEEWIKRIVGLPGETVEGRDGAVWINGRRLVEPYLADGVTISTFPPQVVPVGHLWVMGDNRTNSSDSRSVGAVAVDSVVGRAILTVWPPGRASFL
jgi:signal peptidase I